MTSGYRILTPPPREKSKTCLQCISMAVAYTDIILLSLNMSVLTHSADLPFGVLFTVLMIFLSIYLFLAIYLLDGSRKRKYWNIYYWTNIQLFLLVFSILCAIPPLALIYDEDVTRCLTYIFTFRGVTLLPVLLFRRELRKARLERMPFRGC